MIIGFTGHQKIAHPERWTWVEEQFRQILRKVAKAGDRVTTSLARGGDQRISRLAIAEGLSIGVVVPCEGYENAFADTDALAQYQELLGKSADVVVLEYQVPSEDAFLAAGKEIVDRSELVVALWNGRTAAGIGGTGDIVKYARGLGRLVIHVDPDSMQVQNLEPTQEN